MRSNGCADPHNPQASTDRDEEGTAEILADWGERGRDAAKRSLWLDLLDQGRNPVG
jgi:hypothetical protein